MTMYSELVKRLRRCSEFRCRGCEYENITPCRTKLNDEAADAIEELNRRIDQAIEFYNRDVEKSAMYEALMGISPEPPKEET